MQHEKAIEGEEFGVAFTYSEDVVEETLEGHGIRPSGGHEASKDDLPCFLVYTQNNTC